MARYILLFSFLLIIGCKSQNGKIELVKDRQIKFVADGVMKFDEIIHYKFESSFNYKKLNHRHLSAKKRLQKDIIEGLKPRSIKDTLFIKDLEKLSYKKMQIDTAKYLKITEIYKYNSGNYETACVKHYNDILVFKFQGQIGGVSKICFGCIDNLTFFGDAFYNGIMRQDYETLEDLLK